MHNIKKRELRILFIAGIICIIAPFASDSYVPSMPEITKAFGSTANEIQLTMSLYFLGAALAQLIYGPLSDRYGRRLMILIGFSICVIGSFSCVLSTSAIMLIISRFLQGIGAGACNGLFRAVLRDTFSGARLAQIGSYIGIIYPVVFALAPIIGGYAQMVWGWRESFLIAAIIVSFSTIAVWRFLPETNQNLDPTASKILNIVQNYWTLITHGRFIGYALISSIALSALICYYTAGPFLLQNIVGLSPVEFGYLSIFIAAATIVSQYLNSQFVMKYGIRVMMFFGIVLMALGSVTMLIFALAHMINTWVIIIPVVIVSLAAGFVFSNAMAGAFETFGHMAGIAGAMYGFLQMLGSVFTSILLAQIHEKTQMPLALIFVSLAITAVIIYYLLHRNKGTPLEQNQLLIKQRDS